MARVSGGDVGMIGVLLVDDQPLVRSGLRLILEAAEGIAVVAEAGDGAEAVDYCRRVEGPRPDVVLMDVRMPLVDGVDATREIVAGPEPRPAVLVLTMFDTDDHVFAALRTGAAGFLLKTESPEAIIAGVRAAAAGDVVLGDGLARRVVAEFRRLPGGVRVKDERLDRLTPRELEILVLLGQGLDNREIAERLVVSPATVKTHVTRVLAKLEVTSRVAAAVLAHEHGLVRRGGPVGPDRPAGPSRGRTGREWPVRRGWSGSGSGWSGSGSG